MKTTALIASNTLSAANFTVADEGGLFVPFGDFPQVVRFAGASLREAIRKGIKVDAEGRAVVIQRVDAEAANAMAADMESLMGRARRLFMGAPVYEGHPYHPDPEQRQHHANKRALGWIKSIEVEEDGLRLVASYNQLGAEAVNDAQLAYHSPEWQMEFVAIENGRAVYRPKRLRSTGLTNEPNIPVPALVGSNEGAAIDPVDERFVEAAQAMLAEGEAADFAPLVDAVNEVLAGDDAGFMERLATLRERLPEIAQQVSGGQETVAAWEQILGAAAANGLAAAYEDQNKDGNDSTAAQAADNNPEQDNTDMLKKLLELLAAAGLIQADDPEDVVVTKLGSLKQEMDWRREEMTRQKMEAERIRAMLPAANVADLADGFESLSEEVITVTANTISTLRNERDELATARDAFREALAEATLERLVGANTITGAQVDEARTKLVGALDRQGFDAVLQELCKATASNEGGTRLTSELEGKEAKAKVIASNNAEALATERQDLIAKHLQRLAPNGRPNASQRDLAWSAARKERPDLF